jgi:lactoylglutathione lyase
VVAILSQYCINVRDLERAIEFWNGVCGLPVVSRTDIPQAKEAILQSPHGGSRMQLAQQLGNDAPIDMGTAMWKLYVNTDDCQALYDRAVAAGCESVTPPQHLDRWPVTIAFVKDFDGYLVEIVEYDEAPPAVSAVPAPLSPWDWPTYGHDAQHTFHGRTTLTEATARTLQRAWFFPTGDAVTATPTIVGGTVYFGSWDDHFYAVDLETGKLRWKVRLTSQNAITPYPGERSRDTHSDGGLVTSSAWFEPASGDRPTLIIFGGGYTLYALNAANGAVYWKHDYPGRPGPPDPNGDSTRIFSSPVVVGDRVLFGVDVDGQDGSAGYVVAANVDSGDPMWEFQTDIDAAGRVLDDSCGSVWSSGSVVPDLGLVVFGTADCDLSGAAPYADSVIALRIATGTLAWKFHPLDDVPGCDVDFGATPNVGTSAGVGTTFVGEGGKDGTYYSLDPGTGQVRWSTNVVFGGSTGGFLGTTAYDGRRVYGATALGDFNPSPHGLKLCDPSNPRDKAAQNPTDHAFDAGTGAVVWQANGTSSFAPTTVAGGMTFNGLALAKRVIDVRDGATGRLVAEIGLPQANWSGIATAGNALVFGLGSDFDARSSGVEALTPHGVPPTVPASSP